MSDKNAKIATTMRATQTRRKSQTVRVRTLKIATNRLTKQQKETIERLFLEAKWLRNDMLTWLNNGNNINDYETKTTQVQVKLTNNTYQTRYLNNIGSQMKQSVQKQLLNDMRGLTARKKNGGKTGRLKYCSEINSLDLKQYGNTYRFKSEHKMKIQNIKGEVYVHGTKQLNGVVEYANAKLIKKNGSFYIAITCLYDSNDVKNSDNYVDNTVIGLDMGVKDHITLSNGEKINVMISETDRLKRLQRKLSRQVKGSNNYNKTRGLIKNEYVKMDNRKDEKSNKIVCSLLRNELVFLQDENISSWRRRDGFVKAGRRLQHSVLGRVKSRLVNSDTGRVVVLRKNSATTKTCRCGVKKRTISLTDRVFSCNSCGYSMDRDVHAAQNMVRLGFLDIPAERGDFKLVENVSDWDTTVFQQYSAMQETAMLKT